MTLETLIRLARSACLSYYAMDTLSDGERIHANAIDRLYRAVVDADPDARLLTVGEQDGELATQLQGVRS